MNKITIREVKAALKDGNFRKKLPEILKEDIQKYEQNPNCVCNLSVYRNVLKYATKELLQYFPNSEVTELPPLQENNWSVINCHIDELENKLKNLSVGRMQIAVARYEDQVTVIVNELENFVN